MSSQKIPSLAARAAGAEIVEAMNNQGYTLSQSEHDGDKLYYVFARGAHEISVEVWE